MIDTLNDLKQLVVQAAAEKKAFDILVMDLRERSDLTDFFVICSATSRMQVQAITDSILDQVYESPHKLSSRDLEAISVKYINKFIPKLILPALSMGIFLEYFFIKFSSFLENPVVPITTLFFSLEAIFSTSNVHFGIVKSIIIFAFLNADSEFN